MAIPPPLPHHLPPPPSQKRQQAVSAVVVALAAHHRQAWRKRDANSAAPDAGDLAAEVGRAARWPPRRAPHYRSPAAVAAIDAAGRRYKLGGAWLEEEARVARRGPGTGLAASRAMVTFGPVPQARCTWRRCEHRAPHLLKVPVVCCRTYEGAYRCQAWKVVVQRLANRSTAPLASMKRRKCRPHQQAPGQMLPQGYGAHSCGCTCCCLASRPRVVWEGSAAAARIRGLRRAKLELRKDPSAPLQRVLPHLGWASSLQTT